MSGVIICLNVGGVKYTTSKHTLTKYPESMLGAMFSQNMPSQVDKDGWYFIDRDGEVFRYILQFLRSGELILPDNPNELKLLKCEAEFFQIKPLLDRLITHEINMIKDHQTTSICISGITYDGYDYEKEGERYLIKSFVCQKVNSDVFKIVYQQEKEYLDETEDRENYVLLDLKSKDFVNSILGQWILETTTQIKSCDELISILLFTGFDQGSIDTLSSFTLDEFHDTKLEVLSFVKPV